jgi:hypothetical protein
VKKSTLFLAAGVALVLIPIPPITTIPGIILFGVGATMRAKGD